MTSTLEAARNSDSRPSTWRRKTPVMTDLETVELAARRAASRLSSHDLALALETFASELTMIINARRKLRYEFSGDDETLKARPMSKMFDYISGKSEGREAELEASLEHMGGHLSIEIEENAKLRAENERLKALLRRLLPLAEACPDSGPMEGLWYSGEARRLIDEAHKITSQ